MLSLSPCRPAPFIIGTGGVHGEAVDGKEEGRGGEEGVKTVVGMA